MTPEVIRRRLEWELVEAGFRNPRLIGISFRPDAGIDFSFMSLSFSFKTLDNMARQLRTKQIDFMADRYRSITPHETTTFVVKDARV